MTFAEQTHYGLRKSRLNIERLGLGLASAHLLLAVNDTVAKVCALSSACIFAYKCILSMQQQRREYRS